MLQSDMQGEVDDLIRRLGVPTRQSISLGTKQQWDRRGRRSEVCMVVRRPTGRLLTFTKTFYPPGIFRYEKAPELNDTWREWGRFRAVVHRTVGQALAHE